MSSADLVPQNDVEPVITGSLFTEQQIDTALLALAANGGSYRRTERQLKAAGLDVSHDSLRRWKEETYPQRYQALHKKHQRDIEPLVTTSVTELALSASRAAALAVALEHDRLLKGDVKDAAASARNLATTTGISVDKLMTLEGRPTAIVEHKSAADILKRLQALGYEVVDGTAEEEA